MNKQLWPVLIITAILVVAAVSYFFGYDKGAEEAIENPLVQNPDTSTDGQDNPTPNENLSNFYSGGVVLIQGKDIYLEYTIDNTQGRTKLVFAENAECMRLRTAVPCGNVNLKSGEIVTVSGKRSSKEIIAESVFVTVPQPVPNTSQDFRESENYGYFGTITLTGYVQVQQRVCEPDSPCSNTVDYGYFVFDETTNEALKKFLGYQEGNSFAGKNRIGLGCVETGDNKVYYENDADKGYVTGSITGSDYNRLVAASAENPVQLKMTREVYTGGRGAPDCYSHFRNFDVL